MKSVNSWDISKHGDDLEKANTNLFKKFSSYVDIWSLYIGNNGYCQIANIPNIKKEHDFARKKFAERLYTCFESIICMQSIVEEYSIPKNYEIISPIILTYNDFIAFLAHAGRVRDMLLKLAAPYQLNKEIESIKEIWKQRCIAVHGKKIPFYVSDIIFKTGIGSQNVSQKQNYTWSEIKYKDLTDIGLYFKDTFDTLLDKSNLILGLIFAKIENFMQKKGYVLENPPVSFPTIAGDFMISGSISNVTK